jgi:hypothetical protein
MICALSVHLNDLQFEHGPLLTYHFAYYYILANAWNLHTH